jgi:predicted aconitase with swiveling domain
MREWTGKEKQAINKAWSYVEYYSTTIMGGEHHLKEILKMERGRGTTTAKALIMSAMYEGTKPDTRVAAVCEWASGLILATAFGCKLHQRLLGYGDRPVVELLKALTDAIKVHEEYLNMRLAEIAAECEK